jgi:hypothetical protein
MKCLNNIVFIVCNIFFGELCFANEREAHFLLEFVDRQEIIYVDAPKAFSYGMHVYRGVPGNLQKIEVQDVVRHRDGGTTIITLFDGSSIYVPSVFKQKNGVPTFTTSNGQVFGLVKHQINSENLASFGINEANPVISKAPMIVPQTEKAPIIDGESAITENFKPNPLDSKDVQIEHAFRDQDGNLIVRFRFGSKSIGTNLTFWGPRQDGKLYQLEQISYARSSGPDGSEYTLSFEAPTDSNPNRSAEIRTSKDGSLTITCGDASRCFFQIPENEERALEASLRARTVGLEGLPKVKRIEYFFKIVGSERYVVVASPKFNYSYDFEVFIGEKGSMQRVGVTKGVRYRDGGTTVITLSDGRVIHSPSPFKNEPAMLLRFKGDQFGILLEEQEKSLAKLADLGINTDQFKIPELRTPISGAGQCLLAVSRLTDLL